MQVKRWKGRAPRAMVIPAVFALGAATACLRGNAAGPQNTTPPIQPQPSALDMQTAFEQVAEKLRPSVVYIKSRLTSNQSASPFRQGSFQNERQDPGEGAQDPFGGQDPFRMFGFPGTPRGGQGFRQMPQFPHHAEASGSGVIVRSDGYILTNDHVVNGADRVTVRLQDGREFVGKVTRDFRSDLALIKIDASNLPAAELADSDRSKVGQWAIAFGSPFGLSDTMTVGVVSALHREQQIGGGTDARLYPSLIQTDASINPGNSGGPLVDIYGRVMGINVAIESPSGGNVGIGFAIPSTTARYIMNQLISHGSVTRGYLGLAPDTLSYDQEQRYGVRQGALVRTVQDNTPAQRAGFQVGDVITRYNGTPVTDDAQLRDMVARTAPGDSVAVNVRRNGQDMTLHVTIGTAPSLQTAENSPAAPSDTPQTKLGVSVGNASDPQVRQQFKLSNSVTSGAVVAEVLPGSPAQAAGIEAGDVIVRLNDRPITNADDLSSVSHALKQQDTVSAVIRRGNEQLLVDIPLG